MAAAGVERAISGHGADLLIGRDLVQQVGRPLASSLEPVALPGSMSPSSPGVNSTAQMSPVAVSIARWTLRY